MTDFVPARGTEVLSLEEAEFQEINARWVKQNIRERIQFNILSQL